MPAGCADYRGRVTSVALIVNPASGSIADLNLDRAAARHRAELERFAIDDAERAAQIGADRIVVAGGDGSIACAAAAAARAGVPLGVVAAGTANDFAARMGLPPDPEQALRLALAGERTREVDLARAGSRPFVNVASLGLPPTAAEEAAELKESLGALAYTVGALRAGLEREPLRCTVRADRRVVHEGGAWQVTIGCSGAFGGGARIDTDADDGRLDLVVIEDGPRLRLAKHALGLRRGSIEGQEGVRSARAAAIEVELEGGGEDLNIDGEVVAEAALGGAEGPLRFGVDGSFRLVVG